MHRRPLQRAAALASAALFLMAGSAMADSLTADGDATTPIVDGNRNFGIVAPGAELTADVRFVLVCVGLQHVDAGQSVLLHWSGVSIVPAGGSIVSVGDATLDPVPAGWAADGLGCPDPVPATDTGTRSHVVLRAPTAAGTHTFSITWDRSVSPLGSNDGSAFSRTPTSVSFTMTVPNNTAPVLTVPASFTVEGDTTGGWTADWSGVTATDSEDDPDPTPSCSPAAGTVLQLGVTNVTCSVTDSGNLTATGGFSVTVVDTTRPTLVGLPSDQSLTTGDPGGAVATWSDPTATDIVDAAPTVACVPASGTTFAIGSTTVDCTATDRSGNTATGSFTITVDQQVAEHTASAIWLEPVAGSGSTFVANRGRTIPVKVRLFVDGVERTSGDAVLSVAPCGGDVIARSPMAWSGGRWTVSIDTSRLSAACWTVAASIDGTVAGAFTLELRGDPAAAPAGKAATADRSAKPSSPTASIFRSPKGKARGR
jgi:hypothetical protein